MSKRRRQHRVTEGHPIASICRDKRRFRDQREANRALRNIGNRSDRDRIPERSYYCDCCNGWHLTSQVHAS